jgi:replicative DNA helicase
MTGQYDRQGNREQEISNISRSLKSLAKELNVPVLALSQLSRAVETRGGSKKPILSDLRESGAIEQDADLVVFIYRPEYYGIEEDEDQTSTIGMAEIIVAKHRNGPLGNIKLRFVSKYAQFKDPESSDFDTNGISTDAEGNNHTKTVPSRMNDMEDDEVPF